MSHDDKLATMQGSGGARRRTVIKRAALIGGATVWATPLVQSIAAPALATGGSEPSPGNRAQQVTMEIHVVDPRYPDRPPLRLCKTIPAKGSTSDEREQNASLLSDVYCNHEFISALMFALFNPARYELPRGCTASDTPTAC